MNILKLFTITVLSFTLTLNASAQSDDWQIGGGQNSGKGYRIGNATTTTTTNTPQTSTSSYYGGHVRNQESDDIMIVQPQSNVSLFDGGHKDAPIGFSIGYMNKDWRTDFGSRVFHENFWGMENKRLHGIQIGFSYQPCMKIGLGIHTGLYYELYISEADAVKEMNWDNFYEHNFYIPLHLMYRLPITKTCALHIFGGLGFNWAFSGQYKALDYVAEDYYVAPGTFGVHRYENRYYEYGSQAYGKDGWPHRLNVQGEFGAALRFNKFQIQFIYSWGMTNHHFYDNFDPDHKSDEKDFVPRNYVTHQNKLSISLGYMTNLSF